MPNAALLLLAREVGGVGAVRRCTPEDSSSTGLRLQKWAEASLTAHCSASYASFQPPPRSTIALSYNCDGTLLASTHGDHTVKLSSCASGKVVRVLSGHRRTPWVVRFHPRKPHLLASGSLDHEVRLWDAHTGQCIARHTFGKPIASLAFHVSADVLAIGCGHKLYMWEYAAQGKLPVIVLKTRRSMRAVHFHPQGLPVVLTAEVQDPSPTPELPATLTEIGPYVEEQQDLEQQQAGATPMDTMAGGSSAAVGTSGEPFTPSGPADVLASSLQLLESVGRGRQQQMAQSLAAAAGFHTLTHSRSMPGDQPAASSADRTPLSRPAQLSLPAAALALSGPLHHLHLTAGTHSPPRRDGAGAAAGQGNGAAGERQPGSASSAGRVGAPGWVPPGSAQLPPSIVPTGWELPFPSNLFAGGQAQAAEAGGGQAGGLAETGGWAATASSLPQVMAAFSAAAWNIIGEEQPPRVRLRIWRFDVSRPTALLAVIGAEQGSGNLRLQISDAVLCSEMGVHFSPCGRFLAGTTACRGPLPAAVAAGPVLGDDEGDAPSQQEVAAALAAALGGSTARAEALLSRQHDLVPPIPDAAAALQASGPESAVLQRSGAAGAAAAAAEAAAAAAAAQQRPERVVFEVRVYSMDGPSFGQVVRAKRIRAAHCLTSVQLSPCCDHMLLAYGKKHISLLRSLVADRGSVVPLHTILEVLRLSDMAVVRVLPSADDEINAACFHPRAGGGIAYGTKEGRLRIIAHDRSHLAEDEGPTSSSKAAGRGVGHATSTSTGSTGREEVALHPSQRELDNLREFVLTQQWLRQQTLSEGLGGGMPARPAGGTRTAQQLQAMQQLWDQRGRGF